MKQQSQSQSQSQPHSQDHTRSQRGSDGSFADDTARAGGGLHPGSDRDDYGSPNGEPETVATDRERERREPGQVSQGDDASRSDTGAPAGYGDRGEGGQEPGRRPLPEFAQQEGRVRPDSEHARQAEQGESNEGAGHPHGDYDIG